MHRLTAHERLLAAALAALAGFVDATGFLQLGGYFVSFMSGNSTRLAVGVGQLGGEASIAGSLIAAFVIGVAAGSLCGHAAGERRKTMVLALVAALLGVAALLSGGPYAVSASWIMAFAMGAENAVFEEAGDIRFGLTYMTGTLVKTGQRIALALRGGDPFGWAPFALQWLALVAGATMGAILHPVLGLAGLWFASSAAALFAILAALPQLRKPAGS